MNRNRILSHLLILGSGRITTMVISMMGTVISTRYLGPSRVGELAFAGAIVGILGQVNAMGMETFLIRAVARAPERSSVLVSSSLLVRLVLAIPAPIILGVYIHFARLDRETATIAYYLTAAMILWSFLVVFVWMLQGREHMAFVAGSDVIAKVMGLAGTLIIIVTHASVVAFAILGPVTNAALLAITLYYVRSYVKLTSEISFRDILDVIEGSLAFWAKDITMTVYGYIDSVILGSLAGARAVGFYSPPTRVFAAALTVPNIVGNATLPLLSRLGIDTRNDFVRVSRKSLALLLLTGVPLTAGLATFSGPVVAALFGSAFKASIPVLVVLSLCLVPIFLNSQFAQILTAQDKQWSWTRIMIASCVVNVLLNFALIPVAAHLWHNGALGSALAMLGTEVMSTLYGAVILRGVVMEPSVARTAVGTLLGGAAQAGIAVLLSSHLMLLIAGEVLGLTAYGLVVVALGAVPREDLLAIWETARRRVPALA